MGENLRPGGHPTIEILLGFVEKVLEPMLHTLVHEHVVECHECQRKIIRNFFRPAARKAA